MKGHRTFKEDIDVCLRCVFTQNQHQPCAIIHPLRNRRIIGDFPIQHEHIRQHRVGYESISRQRERGLHAAIAASIVDATLDKVYILRWGAGRE